MTQPLFITTTFLCSVLDNKTSKIREPFTSPTKQDAIRSFQSECSNDASLFKKFPADYELICLGTFSDNGIIDTYKQYETLALASQFSEKKQG